MKHPGYTAKALPFTRKMVIASVNSNKKSAIHCLTEIDISKARGKITRHYKATGEKISLTAYIVKCFGETIKEFPEMNSFIRRNKLIILEDINISVLVEREVRGQKVPEPLGIQKVSEKSVLEISREIRTAQQNKGNELGDLGNTRWVKFIPGFLLRSFIRIADRNIKMAKKYGKLSVTAVGMYSETASWFIPHGTATVLLTVGSIKKKKKKDKIKEKLCLTLSFDHEIIDGSPAARFVSRFAEIVKKGNLL